MQSTGHTSTHARSFTPMQASAITEVIQQLSGEWQPQTAALQRYTKAPEAAQGAEPALILFSNAPANSPSGRVNGSGAGVRPNLSSSSNRTGSLRWRCQGPGAHRS